MLESLRVFGHNIATAIDKTLGGTMRRLKNRYLAGGLLGALAGFLFAFLDDMEFSAAEAHRGKTHKTDPNAWLVWAALGGVAGVPLALVPRVLRVMTRHPVLTLIGISVVGTTVVFDGVDEVERRLSTTSLGESPSLQPGARTAYPLPVAQSGPDWIEYWYG